MPSPSPHQLARGLDRSGCSTRERKGVQVPRRPPPSPGNRHGMTHGGLATPSPIELEPLEREIFEALAADAPVKDADGTLPAADRAVVSLLAQTWWRLQNVRTWLDEHGEVHTRRYTSDDPKQKRRRERAKRKRRAYDPMRVVELEAKLRRRLRTTSTRSA